MVLGIQTGITNVLFNNTLISLGSSLSFLETNIMDRGLVGVSIGNLNNTIGGLGIISIGTSLIALETNKADRGIVGVSMINLGNTINGLEISSGNLETNKADATLFGVSIARLDADIDSLFQNEIVIATTTSNIVTDLNNLGITVGTSSSNLDQEITSIYNFIEKQIDGKVDQGHF